MSHLRLVWDARREAAPPIPLSPPLRVLSRQIEHAIKLVGASAVADMLAHTATALDSSPSAADA